MYQKLARILSWYDRHAEAKLALKQNRHTR
jgi:hypothetical protein